LDLGDASEDVHTTPAGRIWVSYFDEGIFGRGIGRNGVVCFDSFARPVFKYFDFAEQHNLPFIDDCYAMNVVAEDEVWLSYYSDFPLVSIKALHLDRVWKGFGCMHRAFALLRDFVVFPQCYLRADGQLLKRTLSEPSQTEPMDAVDQEDRTIKGKFRAAARGSHLYLWTESALYKLAST
jgi:hypothetical protein